jgi:hypothetical protein
MQWFDIVKKLGPIRRKDPKTGKMKTVGRVSQSGGGSVRGTKRAYAAPTKYSSERATATASSIEQRTEIPRLEQETSGFLQEQKQHEEYSPRWNELQRQIEGNRLAIAEAKEENKGNLQVQQQGAAYPAQAQQPQNLTQGVKGILQRGPPKKTYTNAEMLARRKQVGNTVNPPVEERQSQLTEVQRRIQEERKKQDAALQRMREQRAAYGQPPKPKLSVPLIQP